MVAVVEDIAHNAPPIGRETCARRQSMLASILWIILVILVVGWLFGFYVANLGNIIHILLVIALIILLYNLFVGSRGRL